jgi:hypothetical protein
MTFTTFHVKDTTGAQTDCPKSLSRKSLRRLLWHHPGSTSGGWFAQLLGRPRGKAHRSGLRKTKVLAHGVMADGTRYRLQQQVPMNLFDRMAARFKAALGKVLRARQRGGQA